MKIFDKLKENGTKILATAVLISFIAPISFLIFKICTTTNDINLVAENDRVKSDYVLMLLQCILGIISMWLPSIITRKLKLEIPNKMYYMYVIFLYAAIFLGEIRNFYYVVPGWDSVMHCFSAIMIGFFGFSLIDILNVSNENVTLSPFFIALFAFCFAVSLGSIWEIYEFASDSILKTNMQKFKLENGTELVGKLALDDTMKDIIVDCVGAFLASFVGFISIRYKKGWLSALRIKIKGKKSKIVVDEEDYQKTDDTAHLK